MSIATSYADDDSNITGLSRSTSRSFMTDPVLRIGSIMLNEKSRSRSFISEYSVAKTLSTVETNQEVSSSFINKIDRMILNTCEKFIESDACKVLCTNDDDEQSFCDVEDFASETHNDVSTMQESKEHHCKKFLVDLYDQIVESEAFEVSCISEGDEPKLDYVEEFKSESSHGTFTDESKEHHSKKILVDLYDQILERKAFTISCISEGDEQKLDDIEESESESPDNRRTEDEQKDYFVKKLFLNLYHQAMEIEACKRSYVSKDDEESICEINVPMDESLNDAARKDERKAFIVRRMFLKIYRKMQDYNSLYNERANSYPFERVVRDIESSGKQLASLFDQTIEHEVFQMDCDLEHPLYDEDVINEEAPNKILVTLYNQINKGEALNLDCVGHECFDEQFATKQPEEKGIGLKDNDVKPESKSFLRNQYRPNETLPKFLEQMFEAESFNLSCANEADVLEEVDSERDTVALAESFSDIPRIITKAKGEEKAAKASKGHGTRYASKKSLFQCHDSNVETLLSESLEITKRVGGSKYDGMHFRSCQEPDASIKTDDGAENGVTISEIISSAASQFKSTTLSMSELSSSIAFVSSDDDVKGLENVYMFMENTTKQSSGESTETTSLGSISFSTPIDRYADSTSEKNHCLVQTIETVESDDDSLTLRIVIDGIETDEAHKERDVYLSHKINMEKHETDDISQSSVSKVSSTGDALGQKPVSVKKSFSIPRLGRKLKIFSNSMRKKQILAPKQINDTWESPITAVTELDDRSCDSSLGDVSLNKELFSIRPRTTVGY